ncbi:TetR/AcrR family transcriptional regulator [Streptomyces sp. NPDC060194]|uniref:TetR/AcrR family transcriptional regulator n=1 Tax=Streptomyces sp. NPDC060194 TaxID=3347069 RepID=UPI0036649A86
MASTETSGTGDIERSLELLWGTGERPTRGPKPGLSLERIVGAAVGIADAEGLDAVSMRRLSQELGAGTMTLYRYVPGKAELLDLMLDRVQGPTSTEYPAHDWRASVSAIAHDTLAGLRRHPWLLHVNQARPVLGPNVLANMEKMVGALRGTGLTDQEVVSVIVAVDGYVSGVARTQVNALEAAQRSGTTEEEFWRAQEPVLVRIMSTGEFPLMASLDDNAFDFTYDHFGFGLARLIDGLDAFISRRGVGEA